VLSVARDSHSTTVVIREHDTTWSSVLRTYRETTVFTVGTHTYIYSRDQRVLAQERYCRLLLLLLLVITAGLVITGRRRSGSGRDFAQQPWHAPQVVVSRYGTERLQNGIRLLRVRHRSGMEIVRSGTGIVRSGTGIVRSGTEMVWSGPVLLVRQRWIRLEERRTAGVEVVGGEGAGRRSSVGPSRDHRRLGPVVRRLLRRISRVRVQNGADHLRQRPASDQIDNSIGKFTRSAQIGTTN